MQHVGLVQYERIIYIYFLESYYFICYTMLYYYII